MDGKWLILKNINSNCSSEQTSYSAFSCEERLPFPETEPTDYHFSMLPNHFEAHILNLKERFEHRFVFHLTQYRRTITNTESKTC